MRYKIKSKSKQGKSRESPVPSSSNSSVVSSGHSFSTENSRGINPRLNSLSSTFFAMSTSIGVLTSGTEPLSPEILLKIFLNLNSQEVVILRSVCQEFLEVIDNNKSLWRILDWKQQDEESPIPALEMFDEKSASTLKGVSIIQSKGGELDARVIGVLDRSKNSLRDLSFTIRLLTQDFRLKMMDLASNCHHLESLLLWYSAADQSSLLPKTRLTRISRQPDLSIERSSNLQVLWCFDLVKQWNGDLDVSALVSFADPTHYDSLQLRSFISKFSTTLVHLAMGSAKGIATPSLSCPSLRILEGKFYDGLPSWIDAPNLQIVIAHNVGKTSVQGLPVSVQELWLLPVHSLPLPANLWDSLPLVCPELKVLKLGRGYFKRNPDIGDLSLALRSRQCKVQEGAEIEGIKMVSLEKLIVPINLFASSQLDELREIVGEVINIKDYPDFIELEY